MAPVNSNNGTPKQRLAYSERASSYDLSSFFFYSKFFGCSAKKQILAQSNSSPVQIEEDHQFIMVIDHVRTATFQFSFPTKLTSGDTALKVEDGSGTIKMAWILSKWFGYNPDDDRTSYQMTVSQPKSILKRSFMTANRTYSMQNTASVKMDVKRRTIQASKSRINRLSRVASAPVSRIYTPYAGPFRYKDTSKMRDDELKKYNLEKCLKLPENHEDSKNRIF
uniref:Uncharacterized protein n=1 Tax=Ditylenchus dipsaci TaxID=166011 RepID=A0A915CNG1_9BILA